MICKTCGRALTWIPFYRRYHCYICNAYPPVCSRCLFDLSWISQYRRYYCHRCREYHGTIKEKRPSPRVTLIAPLPTQLETLPEDTADRILTRNRIGALGELIKIKIIPKTVLRSLLLIAVLIIFMFPLYYMISISLSSRHNITNGGYFPDFFWGNWIAFITGEFFGVGGTGIIFQIIICCLCVAFSILVGFPAAYAFSRYRFTADKHIFFWFLFNRMIPAAFFIFPYFIMFRALGLFDTVYAVVLAYCVFNVPIAVWLLTSFMSSIPREIDEAAFIDGYGLGKFFWKIFLPLCRPGIGVTGFFIWLFSWSEMFIASIITSVDAKPLNAQMLVFRHSVGINYGLSAAAGVFTIIPGLILLYWARSFIAKGFTYGMD